MIRVLNYQEQRKAVKTPETAPSIITLEKEELDKQIKIKVLDYMLNKNFKSAWENLHGILDKDVFDNTSFPTFCAYYHDDTYKWSDTTAMYVLKHNIKLPKDFINHILKFYKDGNQIKETSIDWRKL